MDRTPFAVASIVSVQLGATVASSLFDVVGAAGTVLLRQGVAAVVLLAITRPHRAGRTAADWRAVAALGAVLATMNLSFYAAVERLPLGIAVTIELLGPLGLAAVLSRGARQWVCVGAATCGVVLLAWPRADATLDPVGVTFAVIAATGWAGYIVCNRHLGRRFAGADGLAMAMAFAALLVAPAGVSAAGRHLLEPSTLAIGVVVAMLSAAVPFALELHALRAIDARTFGIIMSTSPCVAALLGVLFLHERLDAGQVLAIGVVSVASVAAARSDVASRRTAGAVEGSDQVAVASP